MMITFEGSSDVSWQSLDKDSKAKPCHVKTPNISYKQFNLNIEVLMCFCFDLLVYV